MPGLCETMTEAAELLEMEAAALKQCHTYKGRWDGEPFAKQEHDKLRLVAKSLRKASAYMSVNPLGGPAKVFDAIADQVRCGEDLDTAMRAFGVRWAKKAERSKRHNARLTGPQRAAHNSNEEHDHE